MALKAERQTWEHFRHREDWQIRYKDGVAHSQITAGEAHNVNPRGDILIVNLVIPYNWNLVRTTTKERALCSSLILGSLQLA